MTGCRCGAEWGGLRAEHCPVGGCHQTFTCTSVGDMHRTGDHAVSAGPNRRRCLTVAEMEAKGMTKNGRDQWMGPSDEWKQARNASS